VSSFNGLTFSDYRLSYVSWRFLTSLDISMKAVKTGREDGHSGGIRRERRLTETVLSDVPPAGFEP
jgi:hypothetical protein